MYEKRYTEGYLICLIYRSSETETQIVLRTKLVTYDRLHCDRLRNLHQNTTGNENSIDEGYGVSLCGEWVRENCVTESGDKKKKSEKSETFGKSESVSSLWDVKSEK